jgi:hypothetical protein
MAAVSSAPAHCSVSSLTDTFQHSGAVVELEVARCWEVRADAKDPSRRVLRLEAREFRASAASSPATAATAAAAASAAAASLPPQTPIEVFLFGLWANLAVAQHDVLCIRFPRVERGLPDADHPWQLVLTDEGPTAAVSMLRVRGWKDRLLRRDGKEYTTESLAKQQEEAEETAAREAEDEAATRAAIAAVKATNKKSGAGGYAAKKQRTTRNSASAESFQTAAASIAAGATSAAPANVVDSVGLASKPPRKRKTGVAVHGVYVYTSLAEAESHSRSKLNFYGVVITSGAARKTKGKDWCSSIVVGDMSLASMNEHVTCNIFRSSPADLPKAEVIKPGDIVRIHRASIERYASSGSKLVATVTGQQSSLVLISGKEGDTLEPYWKSSDTYSEVDPEIVDALRKWSAHSNYRLSAITSAASSSSSSASASATATSAAAAQLERFPATPICQLNKLQNPFFDLYCAVVHVDRSGLLMSPPAAQPGSFNRAPPVVPVVYVWDGTDLPRSLRFQRPLLANGITLLPSPTSGTQTSLASGPVVTPRYGSLLPLQLPYAEDVDKFLLPHDSLLSPGKPLFIKLRNIPLNDTSHGEFYLQFTKLSHVDVLSPQTDPQVQGMMEKYGERQAKEAALRRMDHWRHLTTQLTLPASVPLPFTTIQSILSAHVSGEAPSVAKYRVRARILATIPHPQSDGAAEDVSSAGVAAAAAAPADEAQVKEPAATTDYGLLPIQNICKVFCSMCKVWSDCSVAAADRCSSCSSTFGLSYGYFLQLMLHDSTGLLPALLCGKEADDLFAGLPADNLYVSTTTCRFVAARLRQLTHPGTFIDCHLHAYDVQREAAADQSATQLTSSQEFLSQDFAAFFAPQLPAQASPAAEKADATESEEGSARQQRLRVHRIADCSFKLTS